MASNFFSRWSSRKLQAREEANKDVEDSSTESSAIEDSTVEKSTAVDIDSDNSETEVAHKRENTAETIGAVEQADEPALTLDDVVKVTFDSGVTSFMKEGVEKSVKKAALRKLFHSDEFNYISDMDDHTEDFSNIPALSADEVKGLRNWITEVAENINDALATTSDPQPTLAGGIESGVEMPQSLAHYSEPQVIAQQTPTAEQYTFEEFTSEQSTTDQAVEEDVVDKAVDTPTKSQSADKAYSLESAKQENVTYRDDQSS